MTIKFGIKINRKDTSKILTILNNFIDNNYKIMTVKNFKVLALKKSEFTSQITDYIEDLDHEIVQMDFDEKNHREKSIKDILRVKLKSDLHEFIPTAFDTIGSIAIIDIKNQIERYNNLIGESILQLNPTIKTVFKKSSKVEGLYRIRGLTLIAGENNSQTIHKEHGLKFIVDVRKVYFSPRLSTEHARIAKLVKQGEEIFDMFCAQAPFAFHILKKVEASVTVLDINPHTKILIEKSLKINKLKNNPRILIGDAFKIGKELFHKNLTFHKIIMNHPSGAIKFLEIAISLLKKNGIIFLYIFSPVEDYNKYCTEIVKQISQKVRIENIHKVRQSSPSEYHLCIEITLI